MRRPGVRDVVEGKKPRRDEDLFGEDEAAAQEDWRGEGVQDEASWVEDSQLASGSLHPEIRTLIMDVFGDAGAVLEILRGRRVQQGGDMAEYDNEASATTKAKKRKLASAHAQQAGDGGDGGGGAESEDDEERLTRVDQPERLYLRFRRRQGELMSDLEIKAEASWLTARMVAELGPDLNLNPMDLLAKYKERFKEQSDHYDPNTTTVEEDIEEKTVLVLEMLLNQGLEVPYILTHRNHLISPPLDRKLVWMIYDLDQEWHRVRHLSLHLQKLLATVPEPRSTFMNQFASQVDKFRTGM